MMVNKGQTKRVTMVNKLLYCTYYPIIPYLKRIENIYTPFYFMFIGKGNAFRENILQCSHLL